MHFEIERITRLLRELKGCIYPVRIPVTDYKYKEGTFKISEKLNEDTSEWDIFREKDLWGGMHKRYWFVKDIVIPEEFEGKDVVYQISIGRPEDWDSRKNPQFLIYINNEPVQGFDMNHKEMTLCKKAKAGDIYHLVMHAYCGDMDHMVELKTAISTFDEETEKLFYNIKVPLEVASLLEEDNKDRIDILKYLTCAVNMIDLRKPFSNQYYTSIKEANKYLEDEFYGKLCKDSDIKAHCVGHTHIDVAWRWTLAQTREKTTRSFSTVLNLMKQYPEYIFMSSQPQLYQFIKEDHPEIYENIKKRIQEGRWEPEGAMWLEADCNVTSGESLIRQILFGTRFFREEFGVENRILWLPDVFGYSAALPQILKKSGIDYFMTTKINWNEYNKMPYDTFMWKGIDGSEVLTYFISTCNYKQLPQKYFTTYNGDIKPSEVMGAWKRYQQKDINDDILICFGHGDGGGGPTKEMLENSRRMAKGIPGCPQVAMSNSIDFFEKLEEKVKGNNRLPKWVGELYLEYHRGTYTSMARNKKFNRKSELLFQDIELMCSMQSVKFENFEYPQGKINENWETILLNQFHDILPGSSIKEVYEDSLEQYEKVMADGKAMLNDSLNSIAAQINIQKDSVVVFNQLGFDRSDIVEIELNTDRDELMLYDERGNRITCQVSEKENSDGSMSRKLLFFAQNVPAKGYKTYELRKGGLCEEKTEDLNNVSVTGINSKFFDMKLDGEGNIVSIFDKINQREVLKCNKKGNVIQAFEDKPHNYDAWDINIYYQEKMWEVNEVESVEVIEKGPVRNCVRVKKKFLDSTIIQDIYLYNDIPRIDFDNKIDWKEKQVLLKAAFNVDINAEKAAYDIQYGNVERPVHWNTSWDYAKFEVCAHKWADLSEGGYGVSLINDCKYGYDIKEEQMRLTLLKSAVEPNPDADREVHEFKYSLYPHAGTWREAGTVQMAYSVNCPLYAKVEKAHKGTMPEEFSFVKCDSKNVIIEVVKKAEDSSDIIVRVYDCYNVRSKTSLTFGHEIDEVWECDLMENNLEKAITCNNNIQFEIKPYEIKTFKVRFK